MNFSLKPKNKPEITAAGRPSLQQQRDEVTAPLRDAHQHLTTWAEEANRWNTFEAEGAQAAQLADEVADVLRRLDGFLGTLKPL